MFVISISGIRQRPTIQILVLLSVELLDLESMGIAVGILLLCALELEI